MGDIVDGGVCFEDIQVCNSKEGSGILVSRSQTLYPITLRGERVW